MDLSPEQEKPPTPGPFGSLIEALVTQGIESLHLDDRLGDAQIRGGVEGFELCLEMLDGDLIDFEAKLLELNIQQRDAKLALRQGVLSEDEYWQIRYRTVEVEYCYEVLRAAYYAKYNRLPDDQRGDVSGRALIRYSDIITRN